MSRTHFSWPYLSRLITAVAILSCAINSIAASRELYELKAKKDPITKKYGYENVGDKYNWWAEAHRLGNDKEELNLGLETQWIITPQYDRAAKEFSEGLAAVEIDGKVGFIDRLNRFIIPPQFEAGGDLEAFRFGLAAVKKDGKYGFIDKNGDFVFPPVYDDAESFGDDYLAVVKMGKKFGCIDLLGDTVVPCEHIAKEVMKSVPIKNKKYREEKKRAKTRWEQGYYTDFLEIVYSTADVVDSRINDPAYQVPIPKSLATPSGNKSLGGGFYLTCSGDKVGVIDAYGRLVIPVVYKTVSYQPNQRLFIIESAESVIPDGKPKVGLAMQSGGWIIPPVFESISNFNAKDNKASVTVGELTGSVDVNGIVDEDFLVGMLQSSIDEDGAYYTRRLLGILPTCAAAHNCLGIYYASSQDDLKHAINHFSVAHSLAPDNEDFKANMKAAKSERNSRRWNRVLTGMTIAAAVLTAGAVTYSAIKGTPMTTSSFSSSDGNFGTDGSSYTSSGASLPKSSGSKSSSGSKPVNGSAIMTLQRSYDNWETQAAHCISFPEQHQPGDLKEYQRKMREVRKKLEKMGVHRSKSPYED